MASSFIRLGIICGILLYTIAATEGAILTEMTKPKAREAQLKLLQEYAKFEAFVNDKVTSIFKNLHQEDDCPEGEKDANGVCRKALRQPPWHFNGTEGTLLDWLDNIQEILVTLIPIVIATHTSAKAQKGLANVPEPIVVSGLNQSVNFSCNSGAKPLAMCLWERDVSSRAETIVVDSQVEQEGGRISKGVSYSGSGLQKGECGIRIDALKREDLGLWRCSLVTTGNHQALSGQVDVRLEERSNVEIYAATSEGAIKVLSTGEVRSITMGYVHSIAIDSIRNKLYLADHYVIYRCEMGGTGMESVLDTRDYDSLFGLAFDFITGNVYVASFGGFILTCDGALNQSFRCVTLLSGQENLFGIALNPNKRKMYWQGDSSIQEAAMDGTNLRTFVSGTGLPRGLANDLDSSRLYWADPYVERIHYCNLDDGKVVNIAEASSDLWGIVVFGKTVYWSLDTAKRVECMDKDGGEVRTIYNGTNHVFHLASPKVMLAKNRTNPCEGITCATGICVLTPTSYACRQ